MRSFSTSSSPRGLHSGSAETDASVPSAWGGGLSQVGLGDLGQVGGQPIADSALT